MGAGSGAGVGEPAEFALSQTGGQAVPLGVPVSSEHRTHTSQPHGSAQKQHRVLGHIHDRRGALLRGASHLRCHGDVPRGTAAVSAWQGIPLHFWFLRRLCALPVHGSSGAGSCLANLLQQEASGCLVHHHSGQEEEMNTSQWLICFVGVFLTNIPLMKES